MRKLSWPGLVAAVLLASTPVGAVDLQVSHGWVDGSAATAAGVLAKEFDAGGQDHWVDGAILGGWPAARTAIMQHILGGDPPGAAQFRPGTDLEELVKNNLLLDLTDVAKLGNWDAVIRPAQIAAACHVDDHWWCVPVDLQVANWVWVSLPAFKKAGVDLPRSFEDFLADGPKLKAAGVIPFAMGGQDGGGMVAGAFHAIEAAELGLADREKLLKDKDAAVATGPKLKAALTVFRGLKPYLDDGWAARGRDETAALVIQNKAALAIMDASARGDFSGAGRVAGTDYDCLSLPPDAPAATVDGDVVVFPKNPDPNVEAAQKRLAALLITPRVQALFSTTKGSLPVRDDVDPPIADACAKKALGLVGDASRVQAATGWLSDDTRTRIDALITQFFTDDSMTIDQAQQKYWDLLKNGQ